MSRRKLGEEEIHAHRNKMIVLLGAVSFKHPTQSTPDSHSGLLRPSSQLSLLQTLTWNCSAKPRL